MLRRALIFVLGLICAAATIATLIFAQKDVAREQELSDLRAAIMSKDDEGTRVDWAALERELAGAAGWLEVEGTSISVPVMQSTPDQDENFYLDHDMQGAPDPEGTPYFDKHTSPAAPVTLIYGHHIIGSDAMFSPIQNMYLEDQFSSLGDATLTTREGTEVFKPLCALRVDMTYPVQDMAIRANNSILPHLLAELGQDADITTDTYGAQCARAHRILILITCSSDFGGQRDRTLVVFSR